MSKEYVMQLEATIENLRRDNALLKEENAKYKDLEKQLGCPLEALGKALIQNCFYDVEYNRYRETNIGFIPEEQIFVISIDEWEDGNTILLSDYKKTWWLKRDKSE